MAWINTECCCLVTVSFATPWTVVCQAPLSTGLPRQEYWSGLPIAAPGDLFDPGIEPTSPAWQADILPLSRQRTPKTEYSELKITHI